MSLRKEFEEMFEGKMKDLLIGCPYYLEEMSQKNLPEEMAKKLLGFIVSDRFECPVVANVTTYTDTENDSFLSVIHIRKTEDKQRLDFLADEESISMKLKDQSLQLLEKELGCDSASFEINGNKVSTGADGYYGTMYRHPEQKELCILLSLPDDMDTVANFHREIAYGMKSQID